MFAQILNSLTPFQNNRYTVSYNQSIGEIVTGILNTHGRYKNEYDKICNSFLKSNNLATAKNIFDFLKKNTHYVIEPNAKQTLRSPAAILALGSQKNIGLDCKSYALFIGGILDALNRKGYNFDFVYRFASYKLNDKVPHHVFVVLKDKAGNEIYIDPVLPTFNNRKNYFYKIDKKPMALISISGIGRAKKSKTERKQRFKKFLKKKGRLVLKFSPISAAARNSFLLLTRLNVFNLAQKLKLGFEKDGSKLISFWEKAGGSTKALKNNINRGLKVGKYKNTTSQISGIGVVPAVAASIVTATPLIVKITSILKSLGIDTSEIGKTAKNLVKNIVEKKIDSVIEKQDSEIEQSGNYEQSGEDNNTSSANDVESFSDDNTSNSDDMQDSDTQDGESVEGIKRNRFIKRNKRTRFISNNYRPSSNNFENIKLSSKIGDLI